MAQNDDGGDDQIDAILKMMATLSPEQKGKCVSRMVPLFVTDEKVDSTEVAKNINECIQLPNECNKLHKDIEEAGEGTQKNLRSIADDLEWHCRNTSVVQGVGDGATVLGSTMVLAGLGSSLFGYNEIGEKLVNAGKTVHNVGSCTSGAAKLCQIGIEYWYDIKERIITPYEEKCEILTEKDKELKAAIKMLNTYMTQYPILSKIVFRIVTTTTTNVYKAGKFGAKSVYQLHMQKKSSMLKSKQSLNDEGNNTESERFSGKRESVTNNKASILKTSSNCEKKINPFSKREYVELSVTSAISIPLACKNLYNLKQKFHTGNFSEAAIELRKIADSMQ